MDLQAERARSRERGGRKEKFLFSFSKAILQSHFQKILNFFSLSLKTTRQKSNYVAA
jgi:hypothetical protein